MFAVIRTGGKQYRVQEGDILQVEKLDTEEGQKVVFDEVLLVEDGEKTLIGTPLVDKAQVRAEVIENFKDKKVIVFKKKRRKQYKKKRGHRQELTRVKIEKIISELKVTPKKPAVAKKAEKKVKEKPPVKKKAEKPKKAVKKEVVKKQEVKKAAKAKPRPKKQVGISEKKVKKAKTPSKKMSATKSVSKSKKSKTA